MSNVEGEDREFDDLGLPPDESGPSEPADEMLGPEGAGDVPEPSDGLFEPPAEGGPSEGLADPLQPPEGDPLGDLGGTAPAEGDDVLEEGPVEGPTEEPEEPEQEEEKEETEKPPSFVRKLTQTSPYVVLLGISLLAIIIACLCLFLELTRYGGQIEPPQATMAPAVHSAAPDGVAIT